MALPALTQSSSAVARHFKKGERVAIVRCDRFGSPFFEGYARIVCPVADVPDLHKVRFLAEACTRRRHVFARFQNDPEAAVAELRTLWRAAQTPEPFEWLDRTDAD